MPNLGRIHDLSRLHSQRHDAAGALPCAAAGEWPRNRKQPNLGENTCRAEWAIYGPGNKHGDCAKDWEFTSFAVSPGDSWSSPAYGSDANGVPLLVFGSKDRDDSVYALNASTGALVWRYQTSTLEDSDVGAPPTISPPGRNGFAGGVVYVTGKDKVVYALDLTTGGLIWKYALASGTRGDLSGLPW